MDIYVYADESGVFDYKNEDFYIYGGLLFLNKDIRDVETRKYLHAEKTLRNNNPKYRSGELKACRLDNKHKGSLFRSTNSCIRFGVVIKQKRIDKNIFSHKKSKQRYLDYAFKIGLKRILEKLIKENTVGVDDVKNIYVYVDEHTTATNGLYELREGLQEEFKHGTFNGKYDKFFPPLFPNMLNVDVYHCNSAKNALVRAADIIANRVYFHANNSKLDRVNDHVYITYLP